MGIDYVECPFCKEKDFDLIGLKHHLDTGQCSVFEKTDTIYQEHLERKEDN